MPHLHLDLPREVATQIDVNRCLATLAEALAGCETIQPANVKAYATLRDHWTVGTGHPRYFAHCMASILTGRADDLRAAISDALMAVLEREFAGRDDVGLTVEIREMDAGSYRKR